MDNNTQSLALPISNLQVSGDDDDDDTQTQNQLPWYHLLAQISDDETTPLTLSNV